MDRRGDSCLLFGSGINSNDDGILLQLVISAIQSASEMVSVEHWRPLLEAFGAEGVPGARIAFDECLRTLRNASQPVQAQIGSIRVLDVLMGAKGDFLATQVASCLSFFLGIAQLSNEKDVGKRRPRTAPAFASMVDVSELLLACVEFIDKWGRRFEGGDPTTALQAFPKARQRLKMDGVCVPDPHAYRHVCRGTVPGERFPPTLRGGGPSPKASVARMVGLGGGLLAQATSGTGREELDEDAIDRLAQEVAQADAQFGRFDPRTLDAKARCESELTRWQKVAVDVADRGEFEEFEHISTVTHRISCLLESLKTLPSPNLPVHQSRSTNDGRASSAGDGSASVGGAVAASPGNSATPSAVVSSTVPPLPPKDGSSSRRSCKGSRSHRRADGDGERDRDRERRKSRKADDKDKSTFDGFPAFGGSFESAAVFADSHVSATSPAVWDHSSPTCFGGIEPSGSPEFATAVVGGSHEAGQYAQLEYQVQSLQAENAQLQSKLGIVSAQLREAQERLRLPEPQDSLADARASLSSMREAHTFLQSELDQTRSEMLDSRRRSSAFETQAAERDEVLSQTRKRLFEEKRARCELQDEIKTRHEAYASLQSKLHVERSRVASLERQLLTMQHAFGTTSVLREASRDDGRRSSSGNVTYARSLQGELASASVPMPATPQSCGMCGDGSRWGHSSVSASYESGDMAGRFGSGECGVPVGRVHQQDELAKSVDVSCAHGGGRHCLAGSNDVAVVRRCDTVPAVTPAALGLVSSSSEAWRHTPRVNCPTAPLLSRVPVANPSIAERLRANFRALLARPKCEGVLYEDEHVMLELAVASGRDDSGNEHQLTLHASVLNHSSQPIQQIKFDSAESSNGQFAPFMLQMVPSYSTRGSCLWPKERMSFRGQLDVRSAFEVGPQADLSFLLPDNLGCRARFRLPLSVVQFMSPVQLSASRFLELWHSTEFVQSEVAFICIVRSTFLDAGGLFFFGKCLELGGVMRPVAGVVDAGSATQFVAHAASCTLHKALPEVLVCTELGSPQGERGACRIALRSASYLVNRGLAWVLLESLCDAPVNR